MEQTKERIQINLDFTDTPDLFVDLENMAARAYLKRTSFIKKLIEKERDRQMKLAAQRANRSSRTS